MNFSYIKDQNRLINKLLIIIDIKYKNKFMKIIFKKSKKSTNHIS